MSASSQKKRLFPGQLGTSVFVGSFISLVGVVGWIISINLPAGVTSWVILVSTLSSSLLTIGIASVIYEAFQKEKFLSEVATTVGIAENVSLSGFRFLSEPSVELLEECFESATVVQIAPLDPHNWTRQYMSKLFQAANKNDLKILIFLPSYENEECIARMAAIHNHENTTAKNDLERLPLKISDAWKKSITRKSSSLTIYTYSSPINNGFLVSNKTSLIEISGLSTANMAIGPHLWSCVTSTSTTGTWISEQLKALEENSGIVDMPTSNIWKPTSSATPGAQS